MNNKKRLKILRPNNIKGLNEMFSPFNIPEI